jgi:hypothetical protein
VCTIKARSDEKERKTQDEANNQDLDLDLDKGWERIGIS